MSAEDEIHDLVGFEPTSVLELIERHRMRRSPTTVGQHLRALHEKGLLARRWDGNGRFGRWLYCRPETTASAI